MEPIHQAHALLLEQLENEKANRISIARGADASDLAERNGHLRRITQTYLRYIKAIVEDTNSHLIAGKPIEMVPLVTALVATLDDYLYSPLEAARNEARAEWMERLG
jgi:hypothetical protein